MPTKEKVSFKHRQHHMAGQLYKPDGFSEHKKYPTITVVHPGGGVKQQTAGLYALNLAQNGFVALAWDASHQGESGGLPRYLEDPSVRVNDIKASIDYLVTLPFVDTKKIGVLGICAGGGYAVNAALTQHRIKAVGIVSGVNVGRLFREGDPVKTLQHIGEQQTAQSQGKQPKYDTWVPNSPAQIKQGQDIDPKQATDYYRTPRNQHPNSPNKILFTSYGLCIGFDAFHLSQILLTQPLQVIVGAIPGKYGSFRDGYQIIDRAASKKKNIHAVKGACHVDLYDKPNAVTQALSKIVPFYKENL